MPSNKLLYILPDVTYFAELLPTKKEFTYAIQSFRQVNGEFLDESELLPENIEKLFSKFEKEQFTSLVLPDFLFTDTIVTVKETDENAVIADLKENLLPSLGLTTETHYVNTFVLNQFKGESKVQISAIEKSVLAPIRVSAKNNNISFDGVTALSWSAKSIISLEPSISILQVGSKLYSSLHYIGIDQTTVSDLDEIPKVIETIKTLKGGEPSIQTIYLLSNSVVEEQLSDQLKSILPIQQLASFKEEDAKMPSYIKQIIESGMKTLSIPDYLAPSFEVEKATKEDEEMVEALSNGSSSSKKEEKNEEAEETKADEKTTDSAADELPTPTVPDTAVATVSQIKQLDLSAVSDENEAEDASEEKEQDKEVDKTEKIEKLEEESSDTTTDTDSDTESDDSDWDDDSDDDTAEPKESKRTDTTPEKDKDTEKTSSETKKEDESMAKESEKDTALDTTEETTLTDADAIDLRKFSMEGSNADLSTDTKKKSADAPKSEVIKNNSGVSSMVRMVFITVAVFFATVAIGVGVGLGLLRVTQQEEPVEEAPVVVESPEPTVEASPEPEIVEFDPTTGYSVLVVNATTKAGYAGSVQSDLEEADFDDVDAANAKGDYEDGNYILVEEEIPGLEEYLEEATDLDFTVDTENKSDEDSAEAYDFVVVLAE